MKYPKLIFMTKACMLYKRKANPTKTKAGTLTNSKMFKYHAVNLK